MNLYPTKHPLCIVSGVRALHEQATCFCIHCGSNKARQDQVSRYRSKQGTHTLAQVLAPFFGQEIVLTWHVTWGHNSAQVSPENK
jgi:hypothetical protein